ncbi:MAG: PepSY domain-containing protein [Pseudomonadota bacterium]
MSPRLITLVACVLVAATGSPVTAPVAKAATFQDRVKLQSRSSRRNAPQVRISLDQAASMVRQRTRGQVIDASTRRSGDRVFHRIKVLKDGNVRTYTVDASSGAIRG